MLRKSLIAIIVLTISPLLSTACTASEQELADGATVLVYTDALYQKGAKAVGKSYREALAKRKIKWTVKKAKSGGYAALAENIEKELLSRQVDHIIVALGIDDLWEFKKEQPSEQSLDDYTKSIQTIVDSVLAANKGISLCTPHQIQAGRVEAANQRISAGAQHIKEIAQNSLLVVIDFYDAFAQKNKSEDPGKHLKGITTKDGLKLNSHGDDIIVDSIAQTLNLTKGGPSQVANLGRPPAKGDTYVFLCSAAFKRTVSNLGAELKEHYKETMNVEAPRVVHITWDQRIFTESPDIDVLAKSNATAIFLYPGSNVISAGGNTDKLSDGTFRAALRQRITDIQAVNKSPIFLCTPLLYADAGNKTLLNGPNFKASQLWAEETRAVANEIGLGVIDLNNMCVAYVEKHGADGVFFAGRNRGGSGISDFEATGFNMSFISNAFADALNFDAKK